MNLTGISGDEMLWSLAAQFGRNLDRCDSTPVLWRALSDRLAAFRYQQVDAVILIDDADRAGNSVVPHLIRLAKLEPSPQPRLTLILAGDRLTIGRLGDTLLGLSELRIDLAAWQPDDIAGYLDRSLRQAGGSAEHVRRTGHRATLRTVARHSAAGPLAGRSFPGCRGGTPPAFD